MIPITATPPATERPTIDPVLRPPPELLSSPEAVVEADGDAVKLGVVVTVSVPTGRVEFAEPESVGVERDAGVLELAGLLVGGGVLEVGGTEEGVDDDAGVDVLDGVGVGVGVVGGGVDVGVWDVEVGV